MWMIDEMLKNKTIKKMFLPLNYILVFCFGFLFALLVWGVLANTFPWLECQAEVVLLYALAYVYAIGTYWHARKTKFKKTDYWDFVNTAFAGFVINMLVWPLIVAIRPQSACPFQVVIFYILGWVYGIVTIFFKFRKKRK